MQKRSRVIVAISGFLMLSAFFLPLWQIILEAPQYPEGLGLKIWLNGITGNVDQINGLNHYIGMKHIIVEDFIEFKIVPYIFGFIILLAFLTALTGNKKLLWTVFILLLAFAVVGVADFYLWEYDYGHNLDPRAAIKVPGMSYQPPLIGYKQLLNFIAGSFPDLGGIFTFIGGLLMLWTIIIERSVAKKKVPKAAIALACVMLLMFSSCTREPEALNYGKDACAHCMMTIIDPKFGAEIVSSKGKVFKFDAVECMIDFLKDKPELNTSKTMFLTVNIIAPGTLADARQSFFLKDKAFKSPMGANLAAFPTKELAENNRQDAAWKIFNWQELLSSYKVSVK